MSDQNKDRGRKLAMLGGLGLGLALIGRKRRWRRYMMAQMMGRGFGGYGAWGGAGGYGPWSRFGGRGPWSADPTQPIQLPPFIEATLKAWHDRAHGNVPPAAESGQTPPTAQV